MRSLRTRLLAAASVVLFAFVALCGLSLERAFHDSALEAQQDRLRGVVYGLLGAAEASENGALTLDIESLPDTRLRQPGSGLEAALLDEAGNALWLSPAATGAFPDIEPPEVGSWHFHRLANPDRFLLLFGLRWLDPSKEARRYAVAVVEDAVSFRAQIAAYRRTLWAWLVGISAALLVAQALVLRWGLSPLRRLVRELRGIETGQQAEVRAGYPDELTPLTQALNAMIVAERNQQTRYRNALGDLAHSLKTPLAVLRGMGEEPELPTPVRERLGEQVARMQDISDHQLRRAATAGRRTLSEPVAVRQLAEKIVAALAKVYAAKALHFQLDLPAALRVRVDQSDLYELLGNLLDNAAKWGRTQVHLHAQRQSRELLLTVEDDGSGFPDDAGSLLQRGVRADSRTPGHGIGLATVADIVEAYEGKLELERSALGGARVRVTIPGA